MSHASAYPRELSRIPIKGFLEVTALDYPFGAPGAVLFLGGCNLRCRYCQAAHLVTNMGALPSIALEDVAAALTELRGFVQGVTVTGGEPTVHPGLKALLRFLKELGFLVKLDTWGNAPDATMGWIGEGLIDALAIDVKGPLDRYHEVVQRPLAPEHVASLRQWFGRLAREISIPVEFRTTVHRSVLSEEALFETARQIAGAEVYVLQPYKKVPGFDPGLMEQDSYSDGTLRGIAQRIEMDGIVQRCYVRGFERVEGGPRCASS